MIRTAIAALIAAFTFTLLGAAPAVADPNQECAEDPNSLKCLSYIAETQCETYGPDSYECLAARNDYLDAYSEQRDAWVTMLIQRVEQLVDRVAALKDRIEKKNATIKRLREALRDK